LVGLIRKTSICPIKSGIKNYNNMLKSKKYFVPFGSNNGGNMFGKDEENKNKIEQLEEKVETLENKIANIMDVLEMQDDHEEDDDSSDDEDSEE